MTKIKDLFRGWQSNLREGYYGNADCFPNNNHADAIWKEFRTFQLSWTYTVL